jgi:hypothetical protein
MIQARVDDQRRKLKSFLKLALQLKSNKDELKIKELLDHLKLTKRPLPMAKINELKYLDLMASPYNQPLVSMIKDEKKLSEAALPPTTATGKRNAKS